MNILTQRKENKQWVPVRKEKTAEQRKNEELHGRSATNHGVNKKNDGQLMASAADWRNLQQTHTNATIKGASTNRQDSPPKDKKHGNLQSRILSFEDPNTRPGLYSPEKASKIAYGS